MRSTGIFLIAAFLLACSSVAPASTPATPTPRSIATVLPTVAPPTSGVVSTAPPTTPGGGSEQYEELSSHIPAAISGTCSEVDPTAAGALAVARCQPEQLVGPGGELTYTWYETDDPFFDLLDAKLDEVGDVPSSSDPGTCAAGPILTAYQVGGFVEGRLICAPAPGSGGGLIAWWFEYRFNVVGSILLSEGTYQDLYDAVLAAELEP